MPDAIDTYRAANAAREQGILGKALYYFRLFGVRGVLAAAAKKFGARALMLKVRPAGVANTVSLRPNTSDAMVYEQVFVRNEYGFEMVGVPKFIIDAGANIGLASVYFATRFPTARIIAVEPERSNFEMLCKNTAHFENVVPVRAAIWSTDEPISLLDPHLGNAGFVVEAAGSSPAYAAREMELVDGLTIGTLIRRYGSGRVDILKIDVEGAEREIFLDSATWINDVDTIVVELHERMKPGCVHSFNNGTTGFSSRWTRGENVIVTREDAAVRFSQS